MSKVEKRGGKQGTIFPFFASFSKESTEWEGGETKRKKWNGTPATRTDDEERVSFKNKALEKTREVAMRRA